LRFIALIIFILAVLSDAVDGYIARKSKQKSQAGLVLDPLADKLLLVSSFIYLFLTEGLPFWVVLIIISRDVLILLGTVLIFMVKQDMNILPTRWGKLTTTFQMLTVIFVLLRWKYTFIFWWITIFFTVISGTDYIKRGFKRLYGLDNHRNNH
jgi:cardiolipin synthase